MNRPAAWCARCRTSAPPELNRLFLRTGRWLAPGSRGEVLVGEAFANANALQPGDSIAMLLNGRRQTVPHRGHCALARVHLRIAARRRPAG